MMKRLLPRMIMIKNCNIDVNNDTYGDSYKSINEIYIDDGNDSSIHDNFINVDNINENNMMVMKTSIKLGY